MKYADERKMVNHMIFQEDTITAISTGNTNSGISIIRISGPDAFSVVKKVFRAKNEEGWQEGKSHTVHYGHIIDGSNIIDEVLVLLFRAPKSYTREDVVEIDCHGGTIVTKRVLETILKQGARLAEPGEFTKRAFLNGRIDLTQAEAVMDVIDSTNRMALQQSEQQLSGKMKVRIREIRMLILDDIAYIEAALDDPEHISIDEYSNDLEIHMKKARDEIKELCQTYKNGRIVREGINTIILGQPNTGKSTLLNLFAGEERAIVTEIPGTTRDLLEVPVLLEGLPLNVIDTAGLRETSDYVEKIGVERAFDKAEQADLILYLFDASKEPDSKDFEFLTKYRNKKMIILLNKSDTKKHLDKKRFFELTGREAIEVSAKYREGIEDVKARIQEMFFNGMEIDSEPVYVTSERHQEALKEALSSLEKAIESQQSGISEDFISIDLNGAYQALGKIIGETMDEDLVNRIFEKFCLGK